jgi:hypothetical protein
MTLIKPHYSFRAQRYGDFIVLPLSGNRSFPENVSLLISPSGVFTILIFYGKKQILAFGQLFSFGSIICPSPLLPRPGPGGHQ